MYVYIYIYIHLKFSAVTGKNIHLEYTSYICCSSQAVFPVRNPAARGPHADADGAGRGCWDKVTQIALVAGKGRTIH